LNAAILRRDEMIVEETPRDGRERDCSENIRAEVNNK
jgi:hypothetical protein